MATAVRRLEGDQWVQVRATWSTYLGLARTRGGKSNPKYTYCDGRLTIVTLGFPHESLKLILSWFIETMLAELGIPYRGSGSLTLRLGRPKEKGVEGDTSYYLTNLDRLRGKKKIVMGVDPAPDLEVEVVISHPVDDALTVHASFGVREVWVLYEEGLTFYVLQPDGRYEPSSSSSALPFLAAHELSEWVLRDDFPDDGALRLAFRAWVLTTLLPRVHAAGGTGAVPE